MYLDDVMCYCLVSSWSGERVETGECFMVTAQVPASCP